MIKLNVSSHRVFIFVFSFFIVTAISAVKPQAVEIRNLRVFANNDPSSLPVIVYANDYSEDFINIEFETANAAAPSLSIVFRFCDKDWRPYENSFLANVGGNIEYNLAFDPLPASNNVTSYFYSGVFPNSLGYVDFPFSGKWRFYVTDSHDTTKVYAKGKFYVVDDDYSIAVKLKNETLENKVYFPADLAKIYRMDVSFTLPDELFPFNVEQAEIVENRKIESPYIVNKQSNTYGEFFEWDGTKNFNFIFRNLHPGKEYRQTDTRNVNIFHGPDVNAQRDGIETSRFFQRATKDLNGGSRQINPKNESSTYLNVAFKLRAPAEVKNDVFVVGDFNNWVVSPEYRMENNRGLYSLTLKLKRGIYDYQYVTADYDESGIYNQDWLQLEGNTWETTNNYYVFLYYNEPDKGGYDRIIAYTKIQSGKNE